MTAVRKVKGKSTQSGKTIRKQKQAQRKRPQRTVIAEIGEQKGLGHCITIHMPIRLAVIGTICLLVLILVMVATPGTASGFVLALTQLASGISQLRK